MEIVQKSPTMTPEEDGLQLDEMYAANDVRYDSVKVPLWGEKPVLIRSLSAGAMSRWTRENKDEQGKTIPLGGCRLVAMSLVNKSGEFIVSEDKVQEVAERLSVKDSASVDLIVEAIMTLNCLRIPEKAIKKL